MARRSLGRTAARLLMSGVGLIFILLAIAVMIVRAYPIEVGALAIAGFGAWSFLRRRSVAAAGQRRRNAFSCADRQIERHRSALLSYFRQSIRPDLFGNEDANLWRRHVATFLETLVLPELRSAGTLVDNKLLAALADHVDAVVRSMAFESGARGTPAGIDPEQLSPIEYEQHCANILSASGWTVRPTPVTGDHGADVVAEKDGTRLVIQCKLYGKPVGNKAVQEVYTARPLYDADHACVVAPAGFTVQAQRAAHALSVRLLHHSDLEAFSAELARRSARMVARVPLGRQTLDRRREGA